MSRILAECWGARQTRYSLLRRSNSRRAARGFSLVELLVVMVIIALLMGLLLPAVQSMRTSARSTLSKNNLKQIQLAMLQHEVSKGYLPPSWQATPVASSVNISGWSAFGLMLPYLENGVIFSQLDFTLPYANQPNIVLANGVSQNIAAMRIAPYISPGEPRDTPKLNSSTGLPSNYPINYAINVGTWLVWDPSTNTGGLGAAYPNSQLKSSQFTDGTSTTMGFAEVKSWGSRIQAASGSTPPPMGDATYANIPSATSTICGLPGTMKNNTNHTEWTDGKCFETGFTTVFTPNTAVMCADSTGTLQDTDWSSYGEGTGLNTTSPTYYPTYASNVARSYFPGAVNVSMMDGSVRSVANVINIGVWRAISTRSNKELLPNDFSAN